MKTFTKIWVTLTVIAVIVAAVVGRTAAWLNAMQFTDPGREHLLRARIDPVAGVVCCIVAIPWLIFTPIYLVLLFIHAGAWIFGKFTDGDEHEHKKPVASYEGS